MPQFILTFEIEESEIYTRDDIARNLKAVASRFSKQHDPVKLIPRVNLPTKTGHIVGHYEVVDS